MITNLFICHRPYHYIVASYLSTLFKKSDISCENNCIIFDVLTFNTINGRVSYNLKDTVLSKYEDLLNHSLLFDKFISLSRFEEASIWNLLDFISYYNKQVNVYSKLIKDYEKCDNVFIFSDKEKPVEIIASLCKKFHGSKVYLIDEGLVTYTNSKNVLKKFFKWLIIRGLNFKYIGHNFNYAQSNFIDYFVVNRPEKMALYTKAKILKMPEVNYDILLPFVKSKIPQIDHKNVLFISTPLSEGNYEFDQEIFELKRIISIWNLFGYGVVIKKHPLEKQNKYEIIENSGLATVLKDKLLPVELLYNSFEIIVGIFSSALLTAARLGGKKVISMIRFMESPNEDNIKLLLDHGVSCPRDIKSLRSIVDKIILQNDSILKRNTNEEEVHELLYHISH